jgi:transposase, IS5 family
MKQAELELHLSTKRTRKREFLAQMERVVPWVALVDSVAPYAPEGKKGRQPFAVQTMLRVHFMQQWFTLSDPAMEEALPTANRARLDARAPSAPHARALPD